MYFVKDCVGYKTVGDPVAALKEHMTFREV